MNKSIILLFLLIIALVPLAFFVFADEDSEPVLGPFDYRIMPYCVLEPEMAEEDCETWGIVIDQVYEITVRAGETAEEKYYTFPVEGVYTRNQIPCTDPEQIAVAKYDRENKRWNILSSSYIEKYPELPAEGTYRVVAKILEPGIYAVVQKKEAMVAPGQLFCQSVDTCGIISSFAKNQNPESGFLNDTIGLSFCGIVTGCDMTSADTWKSFCPFVKGSEYPSCTSEIGDCCLAIKDGTCDEDCWPQSVLSGGPGTMDYIDPDCVDLKENPGCHWPKPNVDIDKTEECDAQCTNVSDAECTMVCTSSGGNCCLPEMDATCDSDCGKITRVLADGTNVESYVDPDCCMDAAIEINSGAGNCCDVSCDGICDPDCAVGEDMDCLLSRCPREDKTGVIQDSAACCVRRGDNICDGNGPVASGIHNSPISYLDEFEDLKAEYEEVVREKTEAREELDPTDPAVANYTRAIEIYNSYASMYTVEDKTNSVDCQ